MNIRKNKFIGIRCLIGIMASAFIIFKFLDIK